MYKISGSKDVFFPAGVIFFRAIANKVEQIINVFTKYVKKTIASWDLNK